MDYGKQIEKAILYGEGGDIDALVDAFEMIRKLEREDLITVLGRGGEDDTLIYDEGNFNSAHSLVKRVRVAAAQFVRDGTGGAEMLELYRRCLLFDAPHFFDEYCRYIEFDREPEKKFYEPRRKQLLPIVNALQELADDKLDLLAISMPPGVGKTTTAIFYLTWEAGRHPELQNLCCSHNNEFLRGVYDECLRITDPEGEYLWRDVFPNVNLCGTNAKGLRIDFGKRKRFETLEFTSKGAGNAGKVRATNLLYCDDLVEGIEQAMSNDQMEKLWQVYTDDFRQRKQGNRVKELHIATRWSIRDVIGRLEASYEGNEKARFIRCPALDENDETMWDYPYGLGYTTEMLHEQRSIMDDASWRALYQNEPIEREGQLYAPDEMRRYFALPEREPDNIIALVDSKETGSDFCVMPVAYQYGDDFYIDKFICDNGKVEVLERRVAALLTDRKVKTCQVESNRGGTLFAQAVQSAVRELGGRTSITTKWTQSNKETRIISNSGWAKSHFLFWDTSLYQKDGEYRSAMDMLCGYTIAGRNKHDDVPDALAMLVEYILSYSGNRAEVVKRPF